MQNLLDQLKERLEQKKTWINQNNWANPTSSSYSNGYDSAVKNEIEFLEILLSSIPRENEMIKKNPTKDYFLPVYHSNERIGKIDATVIDSFLVVEERDFCYIIAITIVGENPIDNFNRWYMTPPFQKHERSEKLQEFTETMEYILSDKV